MFSVLFIFFFKQKTAYEMRISDWSSDVCSSDLFVAILALEPATTHWVGEMAFAFIVTPPLLMLALRVKPSKMDTLAGYLAYGVFLEIGRASCRERVCQYV